MFKSKNYLLLLLASLFAIPSLMALFLYTHPKWLSANKVNRGELLSHPKLFAEPQTKQKWRLMLICNKPDFVCERELDKLARIRLALGQLLYKVEINLLLQKEASVIISPDEPEKLSLKRGNPLADDSFSDLSGEIRKRLKDKAINVINVSKNNWNNLFITEKEHTIFIASPINYIILRYKQPINAEDIYLDLKRLLGTTHNAA